MTAQLEQSKPSKSFENCILLILGLAAHMPLFYQLPRWANGLNPTFVHPKWMADSPFPLVLHMAAIHPLLWISIMALSFIRLCHNFGWKLER